MKINKLLVIMCSYTLLTVGVTQTLSDLSNDVCLENSTKNHNNIREIEYKLEEMLDQCLNAIEFQNEEDFNKIMSKKSPTHSIAFNGIDIEQATSTAPSYLISRYNKCLEASMFKNNNNLEFINNINKNIIENLEKSYLYAWSQGFLCRLGEITRCALIPKSLLRDFVEKEGIRDLLLTENPVGDDHLKSLIDILGGEDVFKAKLLIFLNKKAIESNFSGE